MRIVCFIYYVGKVVGKGFVDHVNFLRIPVSSLAHFRTATSDPFVHVKHLSSGSKSVLDTSKRTWNIRCNFASDLSTGPL